MFAAAASTSLGNFGQDFAPVEITKEMVRLDNIATDPGNPTGSSIFTITITPPKGVSLEPFRLWLLSQFSLGGTDLAAADIFKYPLERASDFTPFETYTPISVTAADLSVYADYSAPPSPPAGLDLTKQMSLEYLTISSGVLSPDFAPEITKYNVIVQYSVSSMELVVAPLDASSAVSINGYPAEPAKGAKVTKTEAFAAGSSTIVPILVRVDPALGFFIGGYRVVVRRFSLAEMASFFTLASDQAAGAVVANPYGINVTLSAEYWSSSGTSIASSAISNLDFEWFYTRSDGGTNGTIETVVVSGGSRVLRIDSLQVGTFTYFARQKESGALTYVVSSGATKSSSDRWVLALTHLDDNSLNPQRMSYFMVGLPHSLRANPSS